MIRKDTSTNTKRALEECHANFQTTLSTSAPSQPANTALSDSNNNLGTQNNPIDLDEETQIAHVEEEVQILEQEMRKKKQMLDMLRIKCHRTECVSQVVQKTMREHHITLPEMSIAIKSLARKEEQENRQLQLPAQVELCDVINTKDVFE